MLFDVATMLLFNFIFLRFIGTPWLISLYHNRSLIRICRFHFLWSFHFNPFIHSILIMLSSRQDAQQWFVEKIKLGQLAHVHNKRISRAIKGYLDLEIHAKPRYYAVYTRYWCRTRYWSAFVHVWLYTDVYMMWTKHYMFFLWVCH